MTNQDQFNTELSRRQLLLAGIGVLSGCGGGGSQTLAGAPGTGGTGIGLQGTITGFGSVIINNIKFDDSAAAVRIDGVTAQTSDLRIGMVANLLGSRQGTASTGQAEHIEVWSVAMGAVTASNAANSFDVAGITVLTDAATTFNNVANAAAINAMGMQVAVWGLQSTTDARTWKATRVSVLATSNTLTATTGLLQINGASLSVNGFTLAGATSTNLANQQLVRAMGTLNGATGVLTVSRLDAVGIDVAYQGVTHTEVEGVVTALVDSAHFSIGSTAIDASQAILQSGTLPINTGGHVEALGVMRNGTLVASQLEIKDSTVLGLLDITGVVDASNFRGLSEFVVRGQECNALNAIVRQGAQSALVVGARVRVVGMNSGDETLMVSDLYIGVP